MASACVLFEDPYVDRLRPINLARATSSITCGACTLAELIGGLGAPLHYHVRSHLRAVTQRNGLSLARRIEGPILYVNAALAPDLRTVGRLAELASAGKPFVALNDQRVAAALVPGDFPEALAERPGGELVAYLLERRLPILDDEFVVLHYAFDVIRWHEKLLPAHLEHFIRQRRLRSIAEHVYIGANADVASNVVFDASDGPILLGDNVRIRPFSYLAGPVKVGDGCLLIDHSAIKHATVLGHTVKAGGEIEAAVIEPYSNKQHHGFLGHAYVGSWVNLGAGTSNSDLKNKIGRAHV